MKTLEERFWPKVQKTEDCWLWTASTGTRGYGQIGAGGRDEGVLLAHRVAWFLTHGSWPSHQLDHLCRNHRCVNPAHLEDVTPLENTRRGMTPNVVAARDMRCHRGHDWTDPANLHVRPGGRRECRECRRQRDRTRRPH